MTAGLISPKGALFSLQDSSWTGVSPGSIQCVQAGKTRCCNWDPTEMWWGGTLRIRKHLLVPRGFRDEWSRSVALPCRWLQQHTITIPSASGRRVTHCGRESLSSAAPPNHKAISTGMVLHQVQNPLGSQLRLSFIPPLLTLHYLHCCILLSNFFVCTPAHLLMHFISHNVSNGYRWLVEIWSFSHTIVSIRLQPGWGL